MTLTIYKELEQRSPEWYEARAGIVTASAAGQLVTPKTLKLSDSDTSRNLIRTLAAERITGHVEDTGTSYAMQRGVLDEPYAIEGYENYTGAEVEHVGFMLREFSSEGFPTIRVGFSPDGLSGQDGFVEAKSRDSKKHLETILEEGVPAENMAQIQTGFFVSGRSWCDYISFSGGLPLWVKRVHPDQRWQETLEVAFVKAEAAIQKTIMEFEDKTKGFPVMERIDHYGDNIQFTF